MGQKKKKKKLIYFSTNYRTEMKLVPIIMDYFLLQFDYLKFSLGVRFHGGLYLTNFFNVNPQILQQNRKIHVSNCKIQIFPTFLTLVRELLDVGIMANARF